MPPTALFIIDTQGGLLNPPNPIPATPQIHTATTSLLSRTRQIIDSARSNNAAPDIELVFVQHEEPPSEGNLQRGTEAWELVFPPRSGDENEYLVSKDVRDTFESNPGLAAQLKARGVKTIVTCGVQSECCVQSTCRGALAAGFEVVLLQGAHSTYDAGGKTAGGIETDVESVLEGEGVVVVEWEEWVRGL